MYFTIQVQFLEHSPEWKVRSATRYRVGRTLPLCPLIPGLTVMLSLFLLPPDSFHPGTFQ